MVRLRQQNSSFLLLETSRIKRKIDGNSYLINLANVFVKSFFRFSDFLLEKGRIKLNPQQLWIFEKAI